MAGAIVDNGGRASKTARAPTATSRGLSEAECGPMARR